MAPPQYPYQDFFETGVRSGSKPSSEVICKNASLCLAHLACDKSIFQFPLPTFCPRFDSSVISPKRNAGRTPVAFSAKLAYSKAFSNGMEGDPTKRKSWLRMLAAFFCLSLRIFWYSD